MIFKTTCASIQVTRLDISEIDQLLTVIAGFVFKPLYIALSLFLISYTWKNKSRPISFIRYGLIFFLAGELICALNYMVSGSKNEWLEILHGLGMVGLGILLPWGIFTLLDEWVLHFSAESTPCALSKLCGACWKYSQSSCKLKQLFALTAPCLTILCLVPFFNKLRPYECILSIFASPTSFYLSATVMTIELRLYPALGALLLLCSLFFLHGDDMKRLKKAEFFFFAGVGFMSFSLFRFILVYSFAGAPQWFNFWEELTELMTILGLAFFFFLFRKSLGLVKKQ